MAYLFSATGLINQGADDYLDPKKMKGKIDHSTAGAQWVWRQKPKPKIKIDNLCKQILALCICSHHSGLIDCLSTDGRPAFFERMNKPPQKTHFEEVLTQFGPGFTHRLTRLLFDQVMPELRFRLTHLYEHVLARSSETQPLCSGCLVAECELKNPIIHFHLGLLTRFLLSCLIDADRIDSADFEYPENIGCRSHGAQDWSFLVDRFEAHMNKLAAKPNGNGASNATKRLNRIRNQVSAHCLARATHPRGLYTLTVPTGGGKTLAGLRFALHHAAHHNMSRIINVIPYTSIIDQNAQTAREILEVDEPFGAIVLEHHSNIEPERIPEEELRPYRLLTENWDAPVLFTTMVQFLESLFASGTRGARRMHRLAGAVIIFDEIQTLPIKCVHLFCNAINFLINECGATVVLCTATQPLLGRLPRPHLGQLNITPECEIMPDRQALYRSLNRVEIFNRTKPEGWSSAETAELALKECKNNGSCLVVVNTKSWARQVFDACRKDLSEGLFHLSTNMCPAHRKMALDQIRSRLAHNAEHPAEPKPVLCVSTQLIEAGVDVDFASVVRCLAGLDSIIQAAGRCNRNNRMPIGLVHIVNPQGENIQPLSDIKAGIEVTRRIIGELKDTPESELKLLDPIVIERFFEYYFFDRAKEMAYPIAADQGGREDTLLNLLSCNPKNNGTMGRSIMMRQSFAAAAGLFEVIEQGTRGVIIPYGDWEDIPAGLFNETDPKKLRSLLRQAQRYTVNVFPNVLRRLQKERAVLEVRKGGGVYYLAGKKYYHPHFGLSA